jgi:hypothetical protein
MHKGISGEQIATQAHRPPMISLTYAPAEADATKLPDLTTQQRFFLQLLQGHLHALAASPKGSVSCTTLVTVVSQGWDLAAGSSEEIRLLNIMGITTVSIHAYLPTMKSG